MTLSSATKNRIFAAGAGAGVNLLLFFIKLYIGLSVNSIAIYTDALNSLADCAVCVAAIIGFILISAGRNQKYPFGKGKSEELLNLTVSAVIVIAGCAFAYASLERFMYPVPVWYSSLYAVIIAATAAVKLALFLFYRTISKKYGSETMNGIAADSVLDFFITLCTLFSFTLSSKLSFSVDGIAGIIISIILIVQGVKMTASACKKIIGRRDDTLCEKARAILEADEAIEKVNSIQCHSYGKTEIFTADIAVKCKTAEEIRCLSKNLGEKINAEIYLSFGGKNEK